MKKEYFIIFIWLVIAVVVIGVVIKQKFYDSSKTVSPPNEPSPVVPAPSAEPLHPAIPENAKKLTDDFLDSAFKHDCEKMKSFKRQSEQIKIEDLCAAGKVTTKKYLLGKITYANDPICELYDLIKRKELIAIGIPADPKYIGGNYSTLTDMRDGLGSYEATIMGVLEGLFEANLEFAEKTESNEYKKAEVSGKFLYKNDVYKNHFLFSKNLRLKVPPEIYDDYKKNNEGSLFSHFVAKHFIFDEHRTNEFSINAYQYSFVNLYKKKEKVDADFDRFRKDYYNLVASLLKHIRENTSVRDVVIILPINNPFPRNTPNYDNYEREIRIATMGAISDYGHGMNEIIVFHQRP